jgi:hypothetical protein
LGEKTAVSGNAAGVSAAFFLGQFGYPFSMPFAAIAERVRATGVTTAIFQYTDYAEGARWLTSRIAAGDKVAAAGYSLGVGTAKYLQASDGTLGGVPLDLLLCVAASTYAVAPAAVNPNKTKRSRLFYGDDAFSCGDRHGGYDETTHVPIAGGVWLVSHLLLPSSPIVINGVLAELAKLEKETDR